MVAIPVDDLWDWLSIFEPWCNPRLSISAKSGRQQYANNAIGLYLRIIGSESQDCQARSQRLSAVSSLTAPSQPMIGQDDGNHGFRHWDEARKQTRVMPPTGSDARGFAGLSDRRLFL